MSRLPVPGSDNGTWGDILNDYLSVEHNADGTQKTVPIAKGGTGATDATTARTNLGLGTAATTASTDYATAAQGTTADGAIAKSLVDTRGDLLVGTADNTVSRLPVGSDGQVLTADALEASGVKWATTSGGGLAPRIARASSGTVYLGLPGSVVTGTNTYALVANRTYYVPFAVAAPISVSAFFAEVTGLVSGSIVSAAIYTSDQWMQPVALVADMGTVSSASTGVKSITGLDIALPAGVYLLAVNSGHTPTLRFGRSNPMDGTLMFPGLTTNAFVAIMYVAETLAGGAFSAIPTAWTNAGSDNSGGVWAWGFLQWSS